MIILVVASFVIQLNVASDDEDSWLSNAGEIRRDADRTRSQGSRGHELEGSQIEWNSEIWLL